jgi:hypothetical protein
VRAEPGVEDEHLQRHGVGVERRPARRPSLRRREVTRGHPRVDAVLGVQVGGQVLQVLLAPGHEQQGVAPRGEVAGEAAADARGGPGDQGQPGGAHAQAP